MWESLKEGYQLLVHNCTKQWCYLFLQPIGNRAEWRSVRIRPEAKVCELHPAPTQAWSVCVLRWLLETLRVFSWCVGVGVCVWRDADTARASLQSDPFGRESRTNQIIVLVWHWVDPSVGQWADYPDWEREWLNRELHPNEYIMSPLSLSTPQWNKKRRDEINICPDEVMEIYFSFPPQSQTNGHANNTSNDIILYISVRGEASNSLWTEEKQEGRLSKPEHWCFPWFPFFIFY